MKKDMSSKDKPARWAWLRSEMPQVCNLVADMRRRWGDAHVDECWQRSVDGEPGWFFAREGVIAIGTPFMGDAAIENFAASYVTRTQALVLMRPPEATGSTST